MDLAKDHSRRTRRISITLGAFVLTAVCSAAQGGASKPAGALLRDARLVRPEVLAEELARGADRLRVIVGLRPTSAMERFDAWNDARRANALRGSIEQMQSDVLGELPSAEFELRHRLENLPFFSGTVTLAGLQRLLAREDVTSIEPDDVVEMHTNQGLTLMNAFAPRSRFGGAGVSIAVCDTGVDYTHPALGGGGFPNSKVIGGYDFGDNDANPMDQWGHGTSVAGIAAGLEITNGSYVGGVAPQAGLYALKMTPTGSSSAFNSTIAACWDWCVTHRNDDPSRPIVVITTSFGGGLYSNGCNGAVPVFVGAAANAVNAGISVFCSSGNDGACNGIAAPACVSNTVAVGAVYSASVGSPSWCVDPGSCVAVPSNCSTGAACLDANGQADQVPCYSNSSGFLDLLAPSESVRAPFWGGGYGTFGGTSAATPFAAGAAAVLVGAAREYGLSLPPSQVLRLLQFSGRPRLDSKSGIVSPRADLGAAAGLVGVWVNFGYSGGENGTLDTPFNTLAEGINASPGTGAPLLITSGSTTEVPVFTKSVTVTAYGGHVLIGG